MAEPTHPSSLKLEWESTPRLMANGKGLELVLGDILAALGKIPSPAAQTDAAEGPKWFEQTQETLTTHSQLINDLGGEKFRIQSLEDAMNSNETAVNNLEVALKKLASQQLSSTDLIQRT